MTEQRPLAALTMVVMLVLAGLSVATPATLAAQGASGNTAVATQGATDVTESAAWLHGNLTRLNESVDEAELSFAYWEAGDRENASAVDAGERDSPGEFRAHLTDLETNTTYVYQALAEVNDTVVNGSSVEFTTAAREIDLNVETEPATNVTNESATLTANVTELDANATNATVWFQYWVEDDHSTKVETDPVAVDGNGTYSTEVANLSSDTTYVFRAHAETNATDVEYTADDRGAELRLETLGGAFEVETTEPTNVTNSSATLNGELQGLNGSASANVSFSYWVTEDPANATTVAAGSLGSPGAFSATVTGLDNNTTYAYVALAETDAANVTGENVTFTPGAETTDEGPSYDGSGPFGQWVSGIITQFRDSQESDGPFGLWLSEVVRENNPGQSQGPPEDVGPDEDKQRGPPEDAGPRSDDGEAETDDDTQRGPPEDVGPDEDRERGPPEDKQRGPPEDVGPDDSDGNETGQRGPPADAGSDDDNQRGPDKDKQRGPSEDKQHGPDKDTQQTPSADDEDDRDDSDDSTSTEETDDSDDSTSTDDGDDSKRGPPEDKPGKGHGPK